MAQSGGVEGVAVWATKNPGLGRGFLGKL